MATISLSNSNSSLSLSAADFAENSKPADLSKLTEKGNTSFRDISATTLAKARIRMSLSAPVARTPEMNRGKEALYQCAISNSAFLSSRMESEA